MLYEVIIQNNVRGSERYFLPMGEARIAIKAGNATAGKERVANNGLVSTMTPGERKYLQTGEV